MNYTIAWNDTATGQIEYIVVVDTQHTQLNLYPCYIYQYSIAAFTVGLGPFSNTTTVQMPEDCKLMK